MYITTSHGSPRGQKRRKEGTVGWLLLLRAVQEHYYCIPTGGVHGGELGGSRRRVGSWWSVSGDYRLTEELSDLDGERLAAKYHHVCQPQTRLADLESFPRYC